MSGFDGLDSHLGNLSRLSSAQTRSISAENPTGAVGGGARATEGLGAAAAEGLGTGWKIAPAVLLPARGVFTIADVTGPGAIQHIWITVPPKFWRMLLLRFYWDGEEDPSIEVPLGDFFCSGWNEFSQVSSIPIAVNPAGGLNSYWQMPFRRSARITVENLSGEEAGGFYYQVTYTLTDVPEDAAYLHAQWRRGNPVADGVHTLLDGVVGQGHYVGTYLAWGSNNNGWWGEGEIKFHLDDDTDYPTICGTGTEDYFGGAWCFEHPRGTYAEYSTPYLGLPQVLRLDGFGRTQQRFGMYRWHIPDPIRFRTKLRVTIQALGWRNVYAGRMRYLKLQDDVASTAWWYQTEPHAPFGDSPTADELEVI
ncbi:DUF2961 domain-containing protein [Catenulispora sp. NF23]|uniref:glycoside hydrolase family 172 protein n=1 Tax=Catenulispora pinistramenti TaxID=2705254 RepID=UPI001BAD4B1D|nr:glycoside hydrolase family 172 protein [Catenulispora pinistramenti]MBS2539956.1 DUF2961 domain-containing protein [Catenulispora pinistramenti]